MTLGDGILSSTVLILSAVAVWRATTNKKWKLIGKITAVIFALFATLGVAWYAYVQYEDRPQDLRQLADVKLGMTPVEVTLALGQPNNKDEIAATGTDHRPQKDAELPV